MSYSLAARWTEAENDYLRRAWAEGKSAGVIAGETGRSRNAVIGRVHRMKLATRLRRVATRRLPKKPRGPRLPRSTTSTKPPRPVENVTVPRAPILPPLMLGLMDLTPNMCRFPYGDPKEPGFGYCGHPKASGSSYCGGHHHVVYRPPERRAVRPRFKTWDIAA